MKTAAALLILQLFAGTYVLAADPVLLREFQQNNSYRERLLNPPKIFCPGCTWIDGPLTGPKPLVPCRKNPAVSASIISIALHTKDYALSPDEFGQEIDPIMGPVPLRPCK